MPEVEQESGGGDPRVLAQVIAAYEAASGTTRSSSRPRTGGTRKVATSSRASSKTASVTPKNKNIVQPRSAVGRSRNGASGVGRPKVVNHPRTGETLAHAVTRMLAQGYSAAQVEGQVRRWHPNMSSTQARSLVKAGRNPVAHQGTAAALPRTAGGPGAPKHASSGGLLNHFFGTAGSVIRHPVRAVEHAASDVQRAELDAAAVYPYGMYYLAYHALGAEHRIARKLGTTGSVLGSPIESFLVAAEAAGLGGDIAIDYAKGESIRDEGPVTAKERKRYINPFHSFLPAALKGRKAYLQGIHKSGKVDWRW